MKIQISITLSLLATFSFFEATAGNPAQKRARTVTGTYELNRGKGSGGWLKVLQLPNNQIQFDIECNRGAPSYNMGGLAGTIPIANRKATYVTNEFGETCEFIFEFKGNQVVLTQNGTPVSCGFGYGVICDGTYKLKSRKPPKFETERE